MNIDDLRERARQMCELGYLVSDERARLDAQLLAAHYNQMADALKQACPIHSSPMAQMSALTERHTGTRGGGIDGVTDLDQNLSCYPSNSG